MNSREGEVYDCLLARGREDDFIDVVLPFVASLLERLEGAPGVEVMRVSTLDAWARGRSREYERGSVGRSLRSTKWDVWSCASYPRRPAELDFRCIIARGSPKVHPGLLIAMCEGWWDFVSLFNEAESILLDRPGSWLCWLIQEGRWCTSAITTELDVLSRQGPTSFDSTKVLSAVGSRNLLTEEQLKWIAEAAQARGVDLFGMGFPGAQHDSRASVSLSLENVSVLKELIVDLRRNGPVES